MNSRRQCSGTGATRSASASSSAPARAIQRPQARRHVGAVAMLERQHQAPAARRRRPAPRGPGESAAAGQAGAAERPRRSPRRRARRSARSSGGAMKEKPGQQAAQSAPGVGHDLVAAQAERRQHRIEQRRPASRSKSARPSDHQVHGPANAPTEGLFPYPPPRFRPTYGAVALRSPARFRPRRPAPAARACGPRMGDMRS